MIGFQTKLNEVLLCGRVVQDKHVLFPTVRFQHRQPVHLALHKNGSWLERDLQQNYSRSKGTEDEDWDWRGRLGIDELGDTGAR